MYGNPKTKDKCWGIAYTAQQKFLLHAHYSLHNKSFNAATLTLTRRLLGLVVANSVAVALIVSYLILLLTTTG